MPAERATWVVSPCFHISRFGVGLAWPASTDSPSVHRYWSRDFRTPAVRVFLVRSTASSLTWSKSSQATVTRTWTPPPNSRRRVGAATAAPGRREGRQLPALSVHSASAAVAKREPTHCACPGQPPRRPAALFNGDALGEIARLVDVGSTRHRRVIRQKLQRHDMQDRRKRSVVLRHADHADALARLDARIGIGEHEQLAAPGAHLVQVARAFREVRRWGRWPRPASGP